jgi:hypothetical protein
MWEIERRRPKKDGVRLPVLESEFEDLFRKLHGGRKRGADQQSTIEMSRSRLLGEKLVLGGSPKSH